MWPVLLLAFAETLADFTSKPPVALEAKTHHVQGLDVEGSKLWVSSVEKAARKGWLYSFDRETGRLEHSGSIEQGERYHPGGIDVDGGFVWVPVAEYKPQSTASVQRRDARTFQLLSQFSVDDHIGAIAIVPEGLVGANWDARDFYVWSREGKLLRKVPNASGVRIQDMKYVNGQLVGGGLDASKAGVVVWLEWPSLKLLRTVSAGKTDRGVPFTNEGIAIEGKSLFLLPEDDQSRLFEFRQK